MTASLALGKIFDSLLSGATTGTTVAGLAMLGGVTVTGPIGITLAGVAIASVAGVAAVRNLRDGQRAEENDGILTWLKARVMRDDEQALSLEEVLSSVINENNAAALPPGVDRAPLTELLAIIRAEGKERETLIEEQTALVQSLSAVVIQNFAALESVLGLVREDLASLRNSLRSIESDLSWITGVLWAGHGPPLRIPRLDDTVANRFRYQAKRVTLVGRERELVELGAFLDDSAPFLWSAWVGQAGMGKSRLALELCLAYAESGWDVGFYDWDVPCEVRWDRWKPVLPTLIVFDYVYQHVDNIRAAMAQLARAGSSLAHPVRCLLLERPPMGFGADAVEAERTSDVEFAGQLTSRPVRLDSPSWWTSLMDPSQGGTHALLDGTNREALLTGDGAPARPRELEGLATDAVRAIFAELARLGSNGAAGAGVGMADAELDARVSAFERAVPDRRPLYVAFAAEAMASGQLPASWDAEALTRYVLNRERARWRTALCAHGVTDREMQDRYLDLLLFATMCGGLRLDGDGGGVFEDEELREYLPTRQSFGSGSVMAALVPLETGNAVPKLEPDMLGELFVLESLRNWNHRDRTLRSAAWRLFPEGHAEFLARTVNSFPRATRLDMLLRDDGAAPTDRLLALVQQRQFNHLCLGDMQAAELDHDWLVSKYRARLAENPRDVTARMRLCSHLVCEVAYAQDDVEGADQALTELRRETVEVPAGSGWHYFLINGIYNAMCFVGPGFHRGVSLVSELDSIEQGSQGTWETRQRLATCCRMLIEHPDCGFDDARKSLLILRRLRRDAGANPIVLEQMAGALFLVVLRSESSMTSVNRYLYALVSVGLRVVPSSNARQLSATGIAIGLRQSLARREFARCAQWAEAAMLFAVEVRASDEENGEPARLLLDIAHAADEAGDTESAQRIRAAGQAIFGGV